MAALRYWPSLVIDGQTIALAHLNPHLLDCPTTDPNLPNPLIINVRYSDHCFSEGYDPTVHRAHLRLPWCRPGTTDPRAFDQIRHTLSNNLPGLVGQLPRARVHFTAERRNYVYAATVDHPTTGRAPYGVFFQIKKADRGSDAQLDLTVVSAYSASKGKQVIKMQPEHIRFLVLAGKTYRGEHVRSHTVRRR